jgi:hypothetical protein
MMSTDTEAIDVEPDADVQTAPQRDAVGDTDDTSDIPTSTDAADINALDGDSDSRTDADTPESPVESALAAAGFRTQPGAVFSIRTTDCTGLASCFLANPTSPYLLFGLPRRPDESSLIEEPFDVAHRPTGMETTWRIAPNEVVVVVGRTPPEAAYFSFAHYVFSRVGPEGRTTVFGPLGNALNQQTLGRTAASPFDAPFAIVIGSDESLVARAEAALAVAQPDHAVDRFHLDPSQVRLGASDAADTIMLLGRIALFSDAARGEAWLTDPPIDIFRAEFAGPYEADPLEREPFTLPRNEPVEAVTAEDVDLAETAVRDALPGYQFQLFTFPSLNYFDVHAQQELCLPDLFNCQGMVGDTVYARTDWRPLEDDSVLVAVGVNHEASGKATYSSVAVVSRSALISTVVLDSRSMPGTAVSAGIDPPVADSLFAVAFARSCEGIELRCLALPDVAPGDDVALLFRAYLEPGAGVAPAAATLTSPRAWRAMPR